MNIIFRHKKENLKKCSLSGLEGRDDFQFFPYPCQNIPDLTNYFVLTLDAPVLSIQDAHLGLCLVDATWRYADEMIERLNLRNTCICRSLPQNFRTAYPRKQTHCSDPQAGLASIEALFIANTILKRNTEGFFDYYHWGASFLEKNKHLWHTQLD